MKKIFSLLGVNPKEHLVKTEILAGLTTFMTMSYILAVNPLILSAAGMDRGAVFSATAISVAIATLVMAFYAKMPFALASGMGLNAFFAYTLVLMMGYTWQEALAAVFIEGIAFMLLTVFKVRQAIVNSIPQNLRYALSVGIGLFIAYLGLKNGHIIISNEATLTAIGPLTPTSGLAIIGILLGAILIRYKVRGALFFTIIITTIIGIPLGVTKLPEGFSIFSMPISIEPIAMKMDFHHFLELDIDYYIVLFTMLLMDIFDTIGTLVGSIESAGMKDKNGQMPKLDKALMADAIGTSVGAMCGTSIVTTYVESTTGIAEGGRTGLTAFTVAILFILSLFLAPFFLIVPAAATTSALVLVGTMMLNPVRNLNFTDITELLPAFFVIFIIPLSASIAEGIVWGVLSYVFVKIFTGRARELSPSMYIIAIFFILSYVLDFLQ
ncbi:MAG: NCS2 family permease [Prevotella sp.]|nr:NCS2 family permease [Prevotella sp.]